METKILILKRNEVIFHEGEQSDRMYDIRAGRVGIFANYGKKDEKMLTELTVDQFFGEMGIIEGHPRSATAVAMGDVTELTVIPKNDFEAYCTKNPDKAILIMKNMSGRIRELTRDYLTVCRTISEAMESEKKGLKNAGLVQRLKKYAQEYNEICKYSSLKDIDIAEHGYYF